MKIEIINKPFCLVVYGYFGNTKNKDYSGTGLQLMDKMWHTVNSQKLKNKGINVWVYGPGERQFAGVELNSTPETDTGLEQLKINIERYAYYKHTGSYKLLKQVGQDLNNELRKRNLEMCFPYIEIYGHWDQDEAKLETEVLICLK